jgi:hypothetical protein
MAVGRALRRRGFVMSSRGVFRLVVPALLAWVFVNAPGCSNAYEYKIRGVIKSVLDGAPLDGVSISLQLEPANKPEGWRPPSNLIRARAQSQPDGRFSIQFDTDDIEASAHTKWTLVLTKTGFVDELVDISPEKEPETFSNTIAVVAYMRPTARDAVLRPAADVPSADRTPAGADKISERVMPRASLSPRAKDDALPFATLNGSTITLQPSAFKFDVPASWVLGHSKRHNLHLQPRTSIFVFATSARERSHSYLCTQTRSKNRSQFR